MPLVALPGHFDGEKVCLDEPFALKPGTRLIVTVLPEEEQDAERDEWLCLSGEGLAGAYGEDEPEYAIDLIREVNPEYEGR